MKQTATHVNMRMLDRSLKDIIANTIKFMNISQTTNTTLRTAFAYLPTHRFVIGQGETPGKCAIVIGQVSTIVNDHHDTGHVTVLC